MIKRLLISALFSASAVIAWGQAYPVNTTTKMQVGTYFYGIAPIGPLAPLGSIAVGGWRTNGLAGWLDLSNGATPMYSAGTAASEYLYPYSGITLRTGSGSAFIEKWGPSAYLYKNALVVENQAQPIIFKSTGTIVFGDGLLQSTASVTNGVFSGSGFTTSGNITISNNSSSSAGVTVNNLNNGDGIKILNSLNGNGIFLTNNNTGDGIYMIQASSSTGIAVENSAMGVGIRVRNTNANGTGLYAYASNASYTALHVGVGKSQFDGATTLSGALTANAAVTVNALATMTNGLAISSYTAGGITYVPTVKASTDTTRYIVAPYYLMLPTDLVAFSTNTYSISLSTGVYEFYVRGKMSTAPAYLALRFNSDATAGNYQYSGRLFDSSGNNLQLADASATSIPLCYSSTSTGTNDIGCTTRLYVGTGGVNAVYSRTDWVVFGSVAGGIVSGEWAGTAAFPSVFSVFTTAGTFTGRVSMRKITE